MNIKCFFFFSRWPLFEVESFCNLVNLFTVSFDQFHASLLNRSIHLFIKKILTPKGISVSFWNRAFDTTNIKISSIFLADTFTFFLYSILLSRLHPQCWDSPAKTAGTCQPAVRIHRLCKYTHLTRKGWSAECLCNS